jgi:hypothetical protein
LHDQKKKINDDKHDVYIKLIVNQYVKDCLDEYLKNKDQNKGKEILEWDESKKLLFEYCDINKRVPTSTVIYKGQRLGRWLGTQQSKIESVTDELYIKLSVNDIIKNRLNKYLEQKEKNKEKISWGKWKILLFEYCDQNKNVPTVAIIYKTHRIGLWLHTQKSKINGTNDDIYVKLAINQYVKNSLDDYLNPNKMWENWEIYKILLFEYCDLNKNVPSAKCTYKNQRIGTWLHTQKRKIGNVNDDVYKKLATNRYVKNSLDEYFDPDKKWYSTKILLFEYCDVNKCIPTGTVIYKGKRIGGWLQHQKKKIDSENDDVYIKLATNQYVKNSLDNYLKFKEQNKDKVKLGWDESKAIFFEYCDINKKVPTRSIIYKDCKIGEWLHAQKSKINSENNDVYIKLATNQYVKKSLDEYLNPDKNWNESKDLLFEYCNKNKSVPTTRYIYKGQRIGQWMHSQKKKINSENNDVYKKLATNQYVKKSLDEYLENKYGKQKNDDITSISKNTKSVNTDDNLEDSISMGDGIDDDFSEEIRALNFKMAITDDNIINNIKNTKLIDPNTGDKYKKIMKSMQNKFKNKIISNDSYLEDTCSDVSLDQSQPSDKSIEEIKKPRNIKKIISDKDGLSSTESNNSANLDDYYKSNLRKKRTDEKFSVKLREINDDFDNWISSVENNSYDSNNDKLLLEETLKDFLTNKGHNINKNGRVLGLKLK